MSTDTLFSTSLANRNGALVIVETDRNIKFAAFYSANIPFKLGESKSHIDSNAILFNITNKRTFPLKNQNNM